ncbi:hypothetical protein NDA13_006577 [Ustilago tritici]|nr:hypothetical protein NDA13_006577 [Ustilago tritici]
MFLCFHSLFPLSYHSLPPPSHHQLVAPPVYLQAASSAENLPMKMEVQVKDENGVAHVVNTSNIGGYQPDTICKVVTILACNVNADYETVKVIHKFIVSVRDDSLQQLEDLSNEWKSAGSNEDQTSIVHDLQHIVNLMIHANHIASYLAEACNNSENGLETQELKEAQTLQQAAFIGHCHSGYRKFRHYTKLNWESIFSTESPATPPLMAAAAQDLPTNPAATLSAPASHSSATPSSLAPAALAIPVAALSSVVPEASVIATSLAPVSHSGAKSSSAATAADLGDTSSSASTSPVATLFASASSTIPVDALLVPVQSATQSSAAPSISTDPSAVSPSTTTIATSLASILHTSTTPSSKVPATFTTPIATLSAPAAHSSATTSSLKPAKSTASNGTSLAVAKHSSAAFPSIACAASMQPVAALPEPLKHSSAKSLSSAPAAVLANPVATSSVPAKHSNVTPSHKKKTRKQRADEMGWYPTWPTAVKEWHNDKQAKLEDWKKDTDKEMEAHDKELERLGFAGLNLARKYVMEYRDGSSDNMPEAERDIDFDTKNSNTIQQEFLDKAREMLKTKGLRKAEEEDCAKAEKLLWQPDAEGKVVEEVDSNADLYCDMPPGDVIVPIQAGTMRTAESHDALGASQEPSMSYSQDIVEPPSKLPFAKTPNTNVMEHNNLQPTNKQEAAMPGSSGAVSTPDITKKGKGKMHQVRDPPRSPPPLSNLQPPVVEVVIPAVGSSQSTNEAKGSQARSKQCTTAGAESQMGSNREGSQAGIKFATTNVGSINGSKDLNPSEASKQDTGDYWSVESGTSDTSKGSTSLATGSQADSEESKLIRCLGHVKAATAKKVGGMHVFKKTQNHARACKILAARHCGPCKRCLQVSIDCVPADSGSYKMKYKPCHRKTHPPCHHKIWLDQTLVTKWDGLVSQGKTHIVANVMVYGSLKVFDHPQYNKIPLKDYLAGVAPKILRAHCRNKFDKFEPLENPFCGNKADQGKTSGSGYEEVAQHGKGTTAG